MLKNFKALTSSDLYPPTPFFLVEKGEKIMLRRSRIPSPSPGGEGFRERSTRWFFQKEVCNLASSDLYPPAPFSAT
jgi:hypothetical protein